MKCLLIDHNQTNITKLRRLAGQVPDLRIAGAFQQTADAFDYLAGSPVDLIFLAIDMPGLNRLEFIKVLLNKHMLVIFTTSKQDHATEDFELNGTRYLLNSLSPAKFLQAVSKARSIYRVLKEKKDFTGEEFLFVRDTSIVRRLMVEDILYAEAMGDYVKFYTAQQPYEIHGTLKRAEERLPKSKFIRVHRSFIVSVDKIDSMQKGGIFIDGRFIPVADAYKKTLHQRLNIFNCCTAQTH